VRGEGIKLAQVRTAAVGFSEQNNGPLCIS